MARRPFRPIGLALLACALVTSGCAADVVEVEPTPTATPDRLEQLLEETTAEFPDLAFGESPSFVDGTTFEFVPDFRPSQGWREVSISPQRAGAEPSSSGSYALDDDSCTVEWEIARNTPGDDRAESDALLDSLARADFERRVQSLPARHPDGSSAGILDVVTALSPEEDVFAWARVMGELRISVIADCTTSDAAATAYQVVHESLPFVITRPDEASE